MITQDLITYIQNQIKKDVPSDLIFSRLAQAGWTDIDAKEGFAKAVASMPKPAPAKVEAPTPVVTRIDPYRELPETDSLQAMLNKTDSPKREEPKVWAPKVEEVKATNFVTPATVSSTAVATPVIKAEPVVAKPAPAVNIDFSNVQNKINQSIHNDIAVKTEQPKPVSSVVTPTTPTQRVIERISSEPKSEPKPEAVVYVIPDEDQELQAQPQPIAPVSVPITTTPVNTAPPASVAKPVGNIIPINKNPAPTVTVPKMPINNTNLGRGQIMPVSKNPAMLSSFAQHASDIQNIPVIIPEKKKTRIPKIFIFVAILLVMGGGVVFASMKGYINIQEVTTYIQSLKIPSFVKKDPKLSIIGTPELLSQMSSYKTSTTINISSPSFSSISAGLMNGVAPTSAEKDSVSLAISGLINHGDQKSLHDYSAVFKSSILKNEISSDLKYDGTNYFVKVPNLTELLQDNAPAEGVVSFSTGQTDLMLDELPLKWKERVGDSNLYKIVARGLPDYVSGIVASSFKDFILNSDITSKDGEDIGGVPTYHYSLNADRASTKKLLSAISSIFISDPVSESQKTLDEVVGSVSTDSIEVWIGKDDNIVRKFKASFSVPLSKVVGLDDKSIGDNIVRVDLQTSFSDFNTTDTVKMPQTAINIQDFTKVIRDMKIKNRVYSFADSARMLRNAEGSYGKKSNTNGSCVAPVSGSLFSPLGHTKGASVAVSSVASVMTNALALTNNTGSCYSTAKEWAVAFPLVSEPTTLFCSDSKGTSKVITSPLTKTSCE